MYLNVGCGTHYAKGWVNTDVWESDTTKPDVKVPEKGPYPFEDNTFDAVYLGHVIEHLPWPEVVGFMKDMQRIAKPGAPMLVVGPDTHKTIKLWHEGTQPWSMVEAVIEHQDANFRPDRENEWWDGAHHHWNCHEKRVETLLEGSGFKDIKNVFNDIPDNPQGKEWVEESTGITWPVVGKYYWQLAYRFCNIDK